ncbi:MAG: 1-deoxy-D-xylulose-5-phosphate reductoisomerase [Clostridia bacterium]|nr:1-deoxy-D-xylulose-5-phosphate reductoisomerase [Clostridia bacterium]
MKNEIGIDLLGSTGSIGEQAIDVARARGIGVRSICAGKNYKRVEEQAREFRPAFCAMYDEEAAKALKLALADTDVEVLGGEQGICEMIARSDASVSLNAIVGKAGLLPTLSVIDAGKRLALANKESLVVAGDVVMKRARERAIEITPVDSEHCAIHQCLRSGEKHEVKRLWITASGGPFFHHTKEMLDNVTVADALAHPTWSMGAKITVDSATLMNKGFELIEASHLFDIEMDRIRAVVHRESIIHSIVEYIDNSMIAQMSVPDMRFCIQYGVTGGTRPAAVIDELDLTKLSGLTFYAPDTERFPLLASAIACRQMGGGMAAVLNAANEVAVESFLAGGLTFRGLHETVLQTVASLEKHRRSNTLEALLEADREARECARDMIARR